MKIIDLFERKTRYSDGFYNLSVKSEKELQKEIVPMLKRGSEAKYDGLGPWVVDGPHRTPGVAQKHNKLRGEHFVAYYDSEKNEWMLFKEYHP